MSYNNQNKDRVLIIHISWESELNETLEKLRDLHKSGVIAYAKICASIKSHNNNISTIRIIMRFYKRKTILQIKNIFLC